MKRFAIPSLVLALPLAAYLSFGSAAPLAQAQAPDRGTIALAMRNGACQATTTQRVKSKRGRTVQWSLSNDCDSDRTVRLTGFRQEGQGRDPLGCPQADRERRVAKGGGGTLSCRIKDDAAFGVYAYDVQLDGGGGQDPELEIEK